MVTGSGLFFIKKSSIEEVSKRYHQNFLLCNNENTACIADLVKVFVKKCMRLHFSRQCSNKL